MRLDYSVKEPYETTSEKVGIVLLNHGGSSIRQDTGREAQYYANHFGLLTIAANRPTSYRWPRDRALRQLLSQNGIEAMKPLAEKLQEKVVGVRGIEKLILAGRSAAGLGVLELASTRELPAEWVYAAEPVACYDHDPTDGPAYLRRYKRAEKAWVSTHPDPNEQINSAQYLPLLPKLSRLVSMTALLPTDIYYNRERWCRPITLQLAQELAERTTDGPALTQLEFASNSFTAPDKAMLVPFEQLATQHPDRLSVTVVPDTSHCTFDRMTVFAERLQPVVNLALTA